MTTIIFGEGDERHGQERPHWHIDGVHYTTCTQCRTLIRNEDGPKCGSCFLAIKAKRKAARAERRRKKGARSAAGPALAVP